MKKLMMMALTGLVLVTAAAPVLALGPVDVEADLALNSKYVWRGMVETPDVVLQPGATVSFLGFGAGFWGNIDTNDVNGPDAAWEFNEFDWILSYSLSLAILNLDAGFINYTFPHSDAASTTEFYFGASVSVLLSPSLKVYHDIDQIKGTYWEASISHAMALSPGTDLELGAGLGMGSKSYIEGYFGGLPANLPTLPDVPVDASMTDYYVRAGVPFHPIPLFTVTPSVTYSSLTGDVKDIIDDPDGLKYHSESDAFVWGLSVSFLF